jgi:hypothetical protein
MPAQRVIWFTALIGFVACWPDPDALRPKARVADDGGTGMGAEMSSETGSPGVEPDGPTGSGGSAPALPEVPDAGSDAASQADTDITPSSLPDAMPDVAPTERLLTVGLAGNGKGRISVTYAGVGTECERPCNIVLLAGTSVTLQASMAGTDSFNGWTGACTGYMATCSLTMDTAKTATANYHISGTPIWARNIGGPKEDTDDELNKIFVATTPSGNVWIAGAFLDSADFGNGLTIGAGRSDLFLLSVSSLGQVLWSSRFGSASVERARGLAVGAAEAPSMIGSLGGAVDFGGGPRGADATGAFFLAKFSPSGQHIFSRTASNQSTEGVAVDGEGNTILLTDATDMSVVDFEGKPQPPLGSDDVVLSKFTTAGTPAWSKRWGGPSFDVPHAVGTDGAGNIYLTGAFEGTSNFGGDSMTAPDVGGAAFVAKYKPDGTHIWSKAATHVAGDSDSKALAVCRNGDFAIMGIFNVDLSIAGANLSAPGFAFFLAKFDSDGNALWSKRIDGDSVKGRAIAADTACNIFLTGEFSGMLPLAQPPLTAQGFKDVFIAKFRATGLPYPEWVRQISATSPGSAHSYSIATDERGTLIVAGDFSERLMLASHPPLQSAGSRDFFVVAFSR